MANRRGNDNDRYVVPNRDRGGWDVVKEGHDRASAHEPTKREAVDRGRDIVRNAGGGELRIANRTGKLIDSDTIAPGHESPGRDTK
jgi:hypothetical protein